jgi:hypothetical protein
MAQVKLSLQTRSIPEKIQFLRQVISQMTGNANFPTPNPPLADLTAEALALETAYNDAEESRAAAREATALQNAAEDNFDREFTLLGSYVEDTSGGDEAKILSSGIPVRAATVPIGELPAPGNLFATDGDLDEEIDLGWDRVRGSRSYLIQRSEDLAAWSGDKVSTKSTFTYPGCTPGKKYWFRVAAIGAAGQGPWSDPATGMAV